MIYQLKTNESKTATIAKTASHFLIGLGVSAAASAAIVALTATATVAAPIAVAAVAVGGIVLSVVGSEAADELIEYVEEKTGIFSKVDGVVENFFTQ